MNIRQNLIDSSKYNIKCPYSMTPQWITIHNTANDASAKNEASYCRNNNYEVSFHYAVDDVEAIQVLPLNRNGWHAGDGNGQGNRSSIGIEICYSRSGGDKFIKAEQNCAKLVAKLLKDFGWGIEKVRTHQSWSGKYCPHRTLDMGWNRFINMIKAELNGGNSTNVVGDEIYRVRKSWANVESQKGAYKDLNNAKTQADKTGLNVYNTKGEQVYPNKNPQPTPPIVNKSTVTYQVYANGRWLPNVTDLSDYAGIFGQSIQGVYCSANVDIKCRVHTQKHGWLPWVSQRSDYAGVYGFNIDGIQIDSSKKVKYRAYVGNRWLPWVYNTNDYAGIFGQSISGIQIVFE